MSQKCFCVLPIQHDEDDLAYSFRYVDPLYFVKSLGLQTDEQQDAQEFSKLFISLLRDQNDYLSNIIDAEFGGRYKYETHCTVCGNVTERR